MERLVRSGVRPPRTGASEDALDGKRMHVRLHRIALKDREGWWYYAGKLRIAFVLIHHGMEKGKYSVKTNANMSEGNAGQWFKSEQALEDYIKGELQW